MPGGTRYELDESLVAVHGAGQADRAGAQVASLEGGDITILLANQAAADTDQVGPVYRAGPGGPIAAPTGRVFVRFHEATSADSKAGDLAQSASRSNRSRPTRRTPAWVRPASGHVATPSSTSMGSASVGSRAVEPQLISEAVRREAQRTTPTAPKPMAAAKNAPVILLGPRPLEPVVDTGGSAATTACRSPNT